MCRPRQACTQPKSFLLSLSATPRWDPVGSLVLPCRTPILADCQPTWYSIAYFEESQGEGVAEAGSAHWSQGPCRSPRACPEVYTHVGWSGVEAGVHTPDPKCLPVAISPLPPPPGSRPSVALPPLSPAVLACPLQALWHLDQFRQGLLGVQVHQCCGADHCLLCAMQALFTEFIWSSHLNLPPDDVRLVVSRVFADVGGLPRSCSLLTSQP